HIPRPRLRPSSTLCSPCFVKSHPPPELPPLSLPDALPISDRQPRLAASERRRRHQRRSAFDARRTGAVTWRVMSSSSPSRSRPRSEEHTSELQSLTKIVCRLLL